MEELERFRKTYPWQVEKCQGKDFRYRISQRSDSDTAVVLFTGGIGLSDHVFRQFLDFSRYYTVITFDYWNEFETNAEFADAVAILLKRLGLKAWFLGQSLGGIVAQIVAEIHPEVVEGLVLSNTGSLSLTMSEKAKNGVYNILMSQRKMRAIASLLPFSVYRKRVFSQMMKEDREELDDEQRKALKEFSYITYTGVTKAHTLHMFNFIFDIRNHFGMIRDDFAHLDGKVYLLIAGDDHTFNGDDIEALVDLMPNPKVDTSMTGGHMAMILNHGEYVEKVRAFIESCKA